MDSYTYVPHFPVYCINIHKRSILDQEVPVVHTAYSLLLEVDPAWSLGISVVSVTNKAVLGNQNALAEDQAVGCMGYLRHMVGVSFFPFDPWDYQAVKKKL